MYHIFIPSAIDGHIGFLWQPTPVFLPGKIPWTEDPGRLQSMGSQKSRTRLSDFPSLHFIVKSAAMNFRVHEKSWYWISLRAGANLYHIPGPWTSTIQQGVSKSSSAVPHPFHHSHYLLNHTPPCPVCGKIVFHESSTWCQKGLDYYNTAAAKSLQSCLSGL